MPTDTPTPPDLKEILKTVKQIEFRTQRDVDHFLAGAYRSVFKGKGLEFREVRDYVRGDEPRSIDWNVTARLGHPFVKTYEEERDISIEILLDVSASQRTLLNGKGNHESAAHIGAILAFSAIRNHDRVGLSLFSSEVEKTVRPKRGRKHVLNLIREILIHQPQHKTTDINCALSHVMKHARQRSVIFLISDLHDTGFEHHLKKVNRCHDLVVIRTCFPPQTQAPFPRGTVIYDSENQDVLMLSRNIVNFENPSFKHQQDFCKANGIALLDAPPGSDFVRILHDFFRNGYHRPHPDSR